MVKGVLGFRFNELNAYMLRNTTLSLGHVLVYAPLLRLVLLVSSRLAIITFYRLVLRIKIEKYTNFSSSMYNSTVDGSTYELSMKTKVGEQEVKFTIEIVKNDEGYGIYNFDIDT